MSDNKIVFDPQKAFEAGYNKAKEELIELNIDAIVDKAYNDGYNTALLDVRNNILSSSMNSKSIDIVTNIIDSTKQ